MAEVRQKERKERTADGRSEWIWRTAEERRLNTEAAPGEGAVASGIKDSIFVIGGTTANGPTALMQTYNAQQNTWSTLPSLPSARSRANSATITQAQM